MQIRFQAATLVVGKSSTKKLRPCGLRGTGLWLNQPPSHPLAKQINFRAMMIRRSIPPEQYKSRPAGTWCLVLSSEPRLG